MKIRMTNVKLGKVLGMLRRLECEAIFARRPWTADSECMLVDMEDGDRVKDVARSGFAYFMDVGTVLEVLEAFGKRRPKLEEKLRLLSHYAENDAYPEWVFAKVTKAPKPAKPIKSAKRAKPTKRAKPIKPAKPGKR